MMEGAGLPEICWTISCSNRLLLPALAAALVISTDGGILSSTNTVTPSPVISRIGDVSGERAGIRMGQRPGEDVQEFP